MHGMISSPDYFDVQNEIQSLIDSLQRIATSKMITLNNHIGQHQVYADRDMFSVVVRNLTTNAIKYTSAQGEITLASELKDNMLVISVKDTGTGMPQDVQDKLFKLAETKSKRGTNNESGTGLGLVLCDDFVKINGGNIWFTSKQGEGSTFFFSIPLTENRNK
jgi:two-component system sensor histidine kinase/response regulator